MSRIGSKTIALPAGVTVEVMGCDVTVKGSKGQMKLAVSDLVTIAVQDGVVIVKRTNDGKEARAQHGLYRSLIANMVIGVSVGFQKKLEIIGVGYKAQGNGKSVSLSLGFSHPVDYKCPEGVEVTNDPENKQVLVVQGIDKQLVGQVAADLRSFRPPEPYKGKGIRYVDEFVRRKVGKAAAKSG